MISDGQLPEQNYRSYFVARIMQMEHQQKHISHVTEEWVPLFTGGSVDVHAL